jgi:hypothetical protein
MISLKRILIFGVVAPILGLAAVACSDDATSENSAQQSDIDTLSAHVQENEVLFAIKAIGDLPLHDMDEEIQTGDVGDRTLPNARSAVRYLALTDWPEELKDEAATIQGAAAALVTALDDGDVEAAKEPATELHEGWHDFADKAWEAIGDGLPPEAGIGAEHESGGETPAADGTPAEDETPDAGGAEGDDH